MTFQKIWKNRYQLESVSVKIGKKYKIGIGMLFFRNKKSVSVCYAILKIVIGRVKIFKIGKNRLKMKRSIPNETAVQKTSNTDHRAMSVSQQTQKIPVPQVIFVFLVNN